MYTEISFVLVSFSLFYEDYWLDNPLKYGILITVKGDGCLDAENTRNCR